MVNNQRAVAKLCSDIHKLMDRAKILGVPATTGYYQNNQLHTCGHIAMKEVLLSNESIIEQHPDFQVVPVLPTLPSPPIIDASFTFTKAIDFFTGAIKSVFGNKRPGYGDASKKPVWWNIDWKRVTGKGAHVKREDLVKLMISMYAHHGIDLEVRENNCAESDLIQLNEQTENYLIQLDLPSNDMIGIENILASSSSNTNAFSLMHTIPQSQQGTSTSTYASETQYHELTTVTSPSLVQTSGNIGDEAPIINTP